MCGKFLVWTLIWGLSCAPLQESYVMHQVLERPSSLLVNWQVVWSFYVVPAKPQGWLFSWFCSWSCCPMMGSVMTCLSPDESPRESRSTIQVGSRESTARVISWLSHSTYRRFSEISGGYASNTKCPSELMVRLSYKSLRILRKFCGKKAICFFGAL